MATPKSQRIGIWIIAFVLAAGTLGSFLVMGLSVKNGQVDNERLQEAFNNYQLKVAEQTYELSSKYYVEFKEYASKVSSFDADTVKELSKVDIKFGDGEEIKEGTDYNAYYIGWNPKGVIFDQSISENSLKEPISSGNMIEGWEEGVIGMKVGGVRELTIPSDKAYGETGKGDDIPANTPLKFIIMIIPKVEEVEIPEVLKKYYSSMGIEG
ncbi:MAG TPA: FKBP-type peptidyl-prolyl cis-trans isomerase [Candidatus Saccharibacteria bacterium]|nr:FKBP-type peptidyl-prolyl cis-trans isomerase [Candidatus Saccharibacteria bacterium]